VIRVLAVIAILAGLLVVFGAGSSSPRADLVVYNGNDVSTLDPQRLSWIPDMRIGRIVYEPLVQHDVLSWDARIVPAAAESWSVSDDGRTYTFTIRSDARWSNGQPVTSGHFRYAWRRGMLPDLASDYAAMFRFIEGADAFYEWRVEQLGLMERGGSAYPDGDALWAATLERFDELVGLRTPDDRTLVVTLREPVPFFLDLAAFAVFCPVYPPLVDQYERADPATGRLVRRAGWTRPPAIVSNGPFEVVDWKFKRTLRLAQNPHYWNRSALNVRTIEIPSIGDPSAAILAFRTGAIDLCAEVFAPYRGEIVQDKLDFLGEHAEAVARLRAEGLDPFAIDATLPDDPRRDAHIVPAFGTYFWNFNCSPRLADGRPNPFADASVRRAFALVVDKKSISEQVRRMGEPTTGVLIPPGSIAGYAGPAGLPNIGDAQTDSERAAIVARARSLLAEAGYPDPAKDFPITVELLFNKDSGHDLIAQVIAKNWQQHLGVPVSLAQKELKVYREDLKNHAFVTSRAGWFGDFADPTTFLDTMKTGDGNNDRNFSDPAYDALLERARTIRDPEARMELLAEAERVLVEEQVPMIPIFHYVTMYMFDPERVTGMSAHPRTKQNLFLIDVLGDGVGAEHPRPMAPRPAIVGSRPGSERAG
jgi:oligopeptide transport system substrate-binding protein